MRKIVSFMILAAAMLIPGGIAGRTKFEVKEARPGSKIFNITSDHEGMSKMDITEVPLTPSMRAAKKKAMEEKPLCPVTVIVDPSETGDNIASWVVLSNENDIPWSEYDVKETVIEVPLGTYLLESGFFATNMATVFIPELKVDGPMEIHISRDMADIPLTAQPLLMDGSVPTLPKMDEDKNPIGYYNTILITGELNISYDGRFHADDYFYFDMQHEGYDQLLTLYTNLDSDKVRFLWSFNLEEPSGRSSFFYLTKTGAEAKENGTVSNDIALYRPFYADVKHSPIYAKTGDRNDGCQITFSTYFDNHKHNSTFSTWNVTPLEIWLCNDMNEKNGMYALANWSSIDDLAYNVPKGVISPGACYVNSCIKYCSTPLINIYDFPEIPGRAVYPINELFSFQDFNSLEFGNSTPICITGEMQVMDLEGRVANYMTLYAYIGNSGEQRFIDSMLGEVEVKLGEDILLPRGKMYDLEVWAEHDAGENADKPLTYIFYDDNIEVFGLPGSNVCEVSINGNGTDACSPTIQRMMIKDLQGNPTIKFEKSEEGILCLAGGDFIKHYETFPTWTLTGYTYAPASLTVEYAAYKSGNYLPLEMMEVPENFFMPGYGAWWEGSLSQVSTQSENGWYDLRITLTDEAGNSQRQTLSPAFYIGELSGVDTVKAHTSFFKVNGGCIEAHNGQEVMVYTLQGKRVENNHLANGLYIVKAEDKVAKILVK